LTGSAGWLSWYLQRKIIMLPGNIYLPGFDDQYPDGKVCNRGNPCNLSALVTVQACQQVL